MSKPVKVAEVLLESLQSTDRLSDGAQRAFGSYYPHLRNDPDYWLTTAESAYQFIYAYLEKNPGAEILDVGCGVGTESLTFARRGARVRAIDVTPESLACARERAQLLAGAEVDVTFENLNVLDLPGDARFDALWLNQSFHHLEPRAQVMDKLAALLRPGGHLFISETNAASPIVQLLLFRHRGWNTIRRYQDETGAWRMYGRERVTTARALVRGFCARGLQCAGVRHYKVFPNSRRYSVAEQYARRLTLPSAFYANYIVEFIKN